MPIDVRQDEPLDQHHTFGLKAYATFFVEVRAEAELIEILSLPYEPKLILGGGSNLFFADDFTGLVIKNKIGGIRVKKESEEKAIVAIGGGVVWHDLVIWAIENDFGGLENLSLIPGTVGAAPIQNIGAYGVEFDSVFHQLSAVDFKTGTKKTFSKVQCDFGYRDSIFKRQLKGQFMVTSVEIELTKKNHKLSLEYGEVKTTLEESGIFNPTIKDISDAIISIRSAKLPDPSQIGNAGSFFKNPVISQAHFEELMSIYPDMPGYKAGQSLWKIPAAWLIERAGWKGHRSGDVGVYDKHALVLVNHGAASGADIYHLAEAIKTSISGIFKIDLESEVNIIR